MHGASRGGALNFRRRRGFTMLTRVAPSRYRGQSGDIVRIAAVPQNNAGVSFAVFRYGSQVLSTQQVQGHPGCEFVVSGGPVMFGAVVTFAPNSPNARYDLFEEVNGALVDLQFPIEALFGPAAQFQIDGAPVAALAGAAAKTAKKKGAKKKAAPRRAAPKKAAKKPAKKKAAKKAAKMPVRKRKAPVVRKAKALASKRTTRAAATRGRRR
jgi:hypothetical protein